MFNFSMLIANGFYSAFAPRLELGLKLPHGHSQKKGGGVFGGDIEWGIFFTPLRLF